MNDDLASAIDRRVAERKARAASRMAERKTERDQLAARRKAGLRARHARIIRRRSQ